MSLLNRNKTNIETVPQEVREYYQTERRERAGVAWLLALGTLVVTLILASGIYFGGRWAYSALTNKKTGGSSVATKTNDTKTSSNSGNNTSNTKSGSSTGTSSTSTSTPSKSTPTTTTPSTPATTTTPTTTTTPKTTTTTPADTSSDEDTSSDQTAATSLANTGPGDTIAIFFAVTIFATLAHRLVLARR